VFDYTAVDLQGQYTPPDVGAGPTSTVYTYDLDKQLTRITRPDSQVLDFGYDSAGRLSTLTMPDGQLGYGYDPTSGKLIQVTASDGGTLALAYPSALLASQTWGGTVAGAVGYTYHNDFRVASITVNGANPITFTYDADSLVTQAGNLSLSRNSQNGLLTGSTLGSITDTWTHNGFGEPVSYSASFTGHPMFLVQYTRDLSGRLTGKVETVDGLTTTFGYTYDLVGRLIEVRQNGTTVASYTYDSNGNRLSHTTTVGTVNGAYDEQDRLMAYGATTYTYTANGELASNITGGQTTTYRYDGLGNLREVGLPDGTMIKYVIDGLNRRVGKRVNGTLVQGFLYQDQLRPIVELDAAGNIVSRFVYATRVNIPDYLVKGNTTYRIISDHLGSPRLVVDVSTGAVAQRMDYDEFGQVVNDTNPGFQPFGFAGGLYDRDLKLVRFGVRDFGPQTGRWTAKDPIGFDAVDTNRYGYVANDPINRIDLTGTFAPAVPIAVGIAIGEALVATGVIAAGVYCIGTHCLGSLDDLLGNEPPVCEASGERGKERKNPNPDKTKTRDHQDGKKLPPVPTPKKPFKPPPATKQPKTE
jgi:RHS repeat-associated protein